MKKVRVTLMGALALIVAILGATQTARAQFVHPGGLHTLADLNRMKTNVLAGNHPWIDDWNVLITDSQAKSNYNTHVQANMGASRQNADLDAHAAYLNAMRWYISGDVNYANKATNILNSWSAAVNQIPSGTDIPGLIGITIFDFALAGEVLRTYPGWNASDFSSFTNMMTVYLYPSCHSFLTAHNGACIGNYWANWDACNIGALIAMGVLCDNTNFFNEGVNYFKTGAGNGSISNAVPFLYNAGSLGQWQESGRDQEHAQLGVGLLGSACQVAWNQGLDMFGFANNRLLAGAEYVAQCNLSHPISSIPYTFYNNCSNSRQCYLSINGLGNLGDRPVWELLYNHYVVLQGLSATNCQAMAQLMRPEHGSIDHFGYGTLTFTLNAAASTYPPSPIPPAPTGLTTTPGVSQVFLKWNPSIGDTAQGFVVRRSITIGGPYNTTVGAWNSSTSPQYIDTTVANGTTYYYVVAATNRSGTSANSAEASAKPAASGALPAAWLDQDVGSVGLAGSATYASVSGNTFIAKGAGGGIGGSSDSFNFVYGSVTGDFSITGRLVNVKWAGTDRVGLMMRESLDPSAKTVTVTLGQTGDRECYFGARSSTGGSMASQLGNDYTWLPVWFKLQRSGNTFTGSQSLDGTNWFTVGSSTVAMTNTYLVGMAVCSAVMSTFNTTTFDNVTTNGVTAIAGPPPSPGGLWASAANAQVTLKWTVSGGATSNNVKRAVVSGGPYTTIATIGTTPAYTDAGLTNGTRYYYVVSALNASGESPDSSEVSAIPNNPLSGTAIGTPGSFNNQGNTISKMFDGDLTTFFDGPDASGDWVGLDFDAGVSNVINQAAYCPRVTFASRMVGGVFQGANVSDFSSGVVTLFTINAAPPQSKFTFQPITNFTTFRYVRYLGPANGNCNVSELKFYGNSYAASLPAIPTNVIATSGDTEVALSWSASAGAIGYNVKRSTLNGGPYALISTNVNGLIFTNTSLIDGMSFYYVLSALNPVGESADSIQVRARPLAFGSPQLGFEIVGGQLQFTWPADHTGWQLQMQTNSRTSGLGTNWMVVTESDEVNQMMVPINSSDGNAFFRLIHP